VAPAVELKDSKGCNPASRIAFSCARWTVTRWPVLPSPGNTYLDPSHPRFPQFGYFLGEQTFPQVRLLMPQLDHVLSPWQKIHFLARTGESAAEP